MRSPLSTTELSLETHGFPTLASLAAFLHGNDFSFPTPSSIGAEKEKSRLERGLLLLSLFMRRPLPTPIAKLFELDFALNFLLVFARPVVYAFALATGEFYEAIL
ncbi:MAG: hypothetical protein A2664_04080 [Candidatus Taylorbacteria bacterium RIFCSPHIGHO2_01_FULL_46_22b]|uniref:Uncharacterized protein n=1 Tax=Candidatus Taylorbacteria bacterium RIFCSPHIGHO2_01_FULL_46_22b TaxID=1802301 RepID=A0A1G2M1J1_9BACT|nr:MAG: hypothetical protein A2664_04080 [Candidatus Taylorbacteria bacterium RIFCSPHIGHO2_01_FULL_46_22b]